MIHVDQNCGSSHRDYGFQKNSSVLRIITCLLVKEYSLKTVSYLRFRYCGKNLKQRLHSDGRGSTVPTAALYGADKIWNPGGY